MSENNETTQTVEETIAHEIDAPPPELTIEPIDPTTSDSYTIPKPANYLVVSVPPEGYSRTSEFGIIDADLGRHHLLCQAWDAPHLGQEPSKVWVPIPGQ